MSTITVELSPHVVVTANQRQHWSAKARKTRALRLQAGWAWRASELPPYERVAVRIDISYPDGRKRDVHNLMPTAKALIDGLVEAGFLPDDDDAHLIGPDLRHVGRTPGVFTFTITITDLDKEPPA